MPSDTTFDLLRDAEPLSQVVFIHYYIQLVFEGLTLNIYPIAAMMVGALSSRDSGFSDALVALIGHRVVDTQLTEREVFSVVFDEGTKITISLDEKYADGPEIMDLIIRGGETFVWRYGE